MTIKNVINFPAYTAQHQVLLKNNSENQFPINVQPENQPSTMKKIGLMGFIILGVSIYCESQRLTFPILKGIVSRLLKKVFR